MKPHLYHTIGYLILQFLTLLLESKEIYYKFSVAYITGYPDGVRKDKILAINGQFPGPTIEAVIGDTLIIDVINNIQDGQDTTIHWHGIFQNGSQFQDGPSMITQCPLKNGFTQRYNFTLRQSGTYWYHSHYRGQYTDGMWGALIIHELNEPYFYDDEILILLCDWYHNDAITNENFYLSSLSAGIPPFPNSPLINGLGRYPCTGLINLLLNMNNPHKPQCLSTRQFRPVFSIQPNKRYRVRVINTGAMPAFTFSIDGHKLTPIEVDGVDIDPEYAKPVDYAELATAQRYSFLITTNKSPARYIIRATMKTDFLALADGYPIVNQFLEHKLLRKASAILQYNIVANSPKPVLTSESFNHLQIVPSFLIADPVYLDDTTLLPLDGTRAPFYFDKQFNLSISTYPYEGTLRTGFNLKPFHLPKDEPLIATMFNGNSLPDTANPVIVEHMDVVDIIINNLEPIAHPIHLHGHDFWVVGKGEPYVGIYDPIRDILNVDTVKRDTVQVAQLSWVVVRYVADNPGLWSFHCHIDWHYLGGMAISIVEGQEFLIANNASIPSEFKRICSLQGIQIQK